jgi:hypothetical protein
LISTQVFDTGDAADALVRNSSLMPRLLNILRPAPALDAALDGIPRWLHSRDSHDVVQVYVGPTGAGAPFHYHENALNALLHGRKRWWLKEPSHAVYSVRHPRAWCRRGVEVAFVFELVDCLPHQHAIDATRNQSVATQDGRRQGRLHLRARSGRCRPSAGELGPRHPQRVSGRRRGLRAPRRLPDRLEQPARFRLV